LFFLNPLAFRQGIFFCRILSPTKAHAQDRAFGHIFFAPAGKKGYLPLSLAETQLAILLRSNE